MATDQFKFTLARLKALPATGKRYTVNDAEIPGLQCRVSATGDRSFSIYKRPKGQHNPVRVKIHSTSTIAAIKTEAQAINTELASGINPNERDKIETILNVTLQDAFTQYMASRKLAKGSVDLYERALADMDHWKDRPLRDISKVLVLELYNKLDADNPTAARRMGKILSAVWNFQNDLNDDIFGRAPTTILNRQKKQWWRSGERNRKITTERLPAWMEAVRNLNSKYGHYLEFLLLTGLRRREAAYLRWEDVNLKAGYFIVRNTKNGSDHCLPITWRTRQLLNSMRGNGELVFNTPDPRSAIKRVTAACGVTFSPHDLRRTFTTMADHSGAGQYSIKGALNHSTGGDVTGQHYAAYKPLDDSGNVNLDEVRSLGESLQKIEDYILSQAKAHRDNVLEVVK